eukprot:SAG22_NODE_17284_length_308_cov_0.598086_1_plen_61_part_01
MSITVLYSLVVSRSWVHDRNLSFAHEFRTPEGLIIITGRVNATSMPSANHGTLNVRMPSLR